MSEALLLAIESSCDETGVALVEGGRTIHANVVASQVALHAPSGGIVPEVAARAHLRWILPVLDDALAESGAAWSDDPVLEAARAQERALEGLRYGLRNGIRPLFRSARGQQGHAGQDERTLSQ